MTKQEAEALIPLTSHPAWAALIKFKTAELAKLREECDWVKADGLANLQGRIAEVKSIIGLKVQVEKVLERK
jgi:hypothetical protein